jgi:uncharacterized membrane protein YqgA involved in biofilm formation
MIFTAGVVMSDERKIIHIFRIFMYISILIGLYLLIYPLITGSESIRRVGFRNSTQLFLSVNYLSSMLSIGLFLFIVTIIYDKKTIPTPIKFIGSIILPYSLIVTGSRAAIIGLILSLSIIAISDKLTKFIQVASISSLGAVGGILLLNHFFNFVGGQRFTIENVINSLNQLISIIANSMSDVIHSPLLLIFGGGFHRYRLLTVSSVDQLSYSHNLIIANVLHIGVPAAILTLFLIIQTLRKLFSYMHNKYGSKRLISQILLGSTIILLMYVMSEGHLTRQFTLWLFLGFSSKLSFSIDHNI